MLGAADFNRDLLAKVKQLGAAARRHDNAIIHAALTRRRRERIGDAERFKRA